MATRLTGLMSGMDTESLIQQLVEARQVKVDSAVKAQKKVEWKQEAWKDLNKKLKNLQSKYLNNMRFVSSYSKKTTKVSNSAAVSVITGENAVNGVQELKVDQLAKTAYLTGGKVTGTEGNVDAASTLDKLGVKADTSITLKVGNGEAKTIEIKSGTTISEVLEAIKKEGLNASFDAKNQRFFISSKESGTGNDFEFGGDAAALEKLGLVALDTKTEAEIAAMTEEEKQKYATKVEAQDAKITLNGATFTSNTNVFEINGLTFTALSETKGETVTVTTQDDVDGIYDMVKNFLKEYNTIVNEMDKLYNADSAKGYEPLTDEEKEALSESEAEKYENKIKDALLRNDSNLGSIRSALKSVMSAGIEVNGKTMHLSDFGIETLGYFEAADNEKNAYHIAGDPDDADTSSKPDVLKSMISTDPSTVISFFSQLGKELYSKMDKLSSSVEGYRSYGSFYDDKKMKEEYSSYTTKIKDLEDKLAAYEDKWYEKFAAMETALAKMQSNTNAVTSLFGGY